MEPLASCGDASQKRKRKTLYNHQEVLALFTNLDTDSESNYEDSGCEFELGKCRSHGQHDSDSDSDNSDRSRSRSPSGSRSKDYQPPPKRKKKAGSSEGPTKKGRGIVANQEKGQQKERAKINLNLEKDRLRKQTLMI